MAEKPPSENNPEPTKRQPIWHIDWIKMAGIAVSVIAGVLYIGELRGNVLALNPDAIKKAQEEAAQELMKLAKKPTLDVRTFKYWGFGGPDSEVEMIGTNEGFCYLTEVKGYFRGGAEAVWIRTRGGSWYLGGKSNQDGVGASARCWKWPD